MVRSGGEDNDCRATNHRVRQNAARLHGSLSGRSDHAAESRYRVVGGSNNLSACRYSMGGVDSMVGFVGGGKIRRLYMLLLFCKVWLHVGRW